MSPVRYDDLPPAMKAQVDKQVGGTAKTRTTQKSLSGNVSPTRCAACSLEFARYTQWERHCDDTGHRRSLTVLT